MSERPASKARVLVVDDHPIFREGLTQLINRQRDLQVCGEAAEAREVMALVESSAPELVLLDLMLSQGDGLELIKQIKSVFPKLPVLVISMHDEEAYAERALRAGAMGYVMKQEASVTVITAIRTILAGELHVSRKVSLALMQKAIVTPRAEASEDGSKLSDRELQVFQFIGAGVSTREIAGRLGVSIKTIETHRGNIKLKLGLASGVDLVNRARAWVRRS